jgi:hypothetical protein
MAITCYKNYGTPPNSTGVPATRTRYALASEIGLLAGHACVLTHALHRGSKNNSGNWRCRMSVVRWMHVGGAMSIGLFAIQKKYDRKTALWAVVASKLDSRMFIVLLRGKSEGWTNARHEMSHPTEQGPFSDSFDPPCNYFAALPIS